MSQYPQRLFKYENFQHQQLSKEKKSKRKKDSELELETISGYVTCMYNNNYWLAFVLDVDVENSKVKLTFLHPQGPACSYKYPATILDVLKVPSSHILTKVNPRTATAGRTYTLTKKENQLATEN